MSGGLDSLCTLAYAINKNYTPLLLHIEYGQRTKEREYRAFKEISQFYNIPQTQIKYIMANYLGDLGGSSLTDPNISMSKSKDNKSIPNSYVPFRNTHLLATAVSWAEVNGAKDIFIGANQEDSPGYPDCRPSYYKAFNELIRQGCKEKNIRVLTPIIDRTKAEIIQICTNLNAPIELSWSCYKSENIPCEKCESCLSRKKGFESLNREDPILGRR